MTDLVTARPDYFKGTLFSGSDLGSPFKVLDLQNHYRNWPMNVPFRTQTAKNLLLKFRFQIKHVFFMKCTNIKLH